MSQNSNPSQAHIGVLPGQVVSSFAVKLPPLSAAKLAKALPHIMADYLADERADTVFCIAPTPTPETDLVLACDIKVLRQTIETATRDKKDMTALWPDYMRIAVPETGIAVLQDGDKVLARRADGTGFCLPKALADAALADETPSEAVTQGFPENHAGFAVGRFGPNLPLGKIMRKAKRTLLLLAAAALTWSSALALQGWQNERQRFALEDRAVVLYKERFPEARRIVNVEAQLRGKIGTDGTAQGFSGLFGRVQNILAQQATTRLEEVGFAAQPSPSLKLTVATPGFSELEQLRRQLTEAGFRIDSGSSEQTNGLIINEMTLLPRGGTR